ncbi:hypothetical protein ACFWF7_31410 [Nocardia sp. NPDC060256]|uniref:hypothetical protein n=1 Tax=unclassified Nocardia TaxID=2637762 RepID=UPI003662205E
MFTRHPGLLDSYVDAVEFAVNDLCDSAQIDVLTRIGQVLKASPEPGGDDRFG